MVPEKISKVSYILFGRVSHLGHVTRSICANFRSPTLRSLNMQNFSCVGPVVAEKKFENVDGRTNRRTPHFFGILIAHMRAFG